MKIKPVTMWAVVSERGWIAVWSVRRTRRASIAAFLEGDNHGWEHYHLCGWRCVKVTVAPVESEDAK